MATSLLLVLEGGSHRRCCTPDTPRRRASDFPGRAPDLPGRGLDGRCGLMRQ